MGIARPVPAGFILCSCKETQEGCWRSWWAGGAPRGRSVRRVAISTRPTWPSLADAGLFEAPVPVALGGRWEGPTSARPLCETYRMLAGGDPSVALVAVMHPTVLAWWLHTETEDQPAWEEQRAAVLRSAMLRRQWGTIASEPGSGGDMLRTRTIAEPDRR